MPLRSPFYVLSYRGTFVVYVPTIFLSVTLHATLKRVLSLCDTWRSPPELVALLT